MLDFQLDKESAKRLQNFKCQYEIQSYHNGVLVDSIFFYDLNEACSYFEGQIEEDISSLSWSHHFYIHSRLHLTEDILNFYLNEKEDENEHF